MLNLLNIFSVKRLPLNSDSVSYPALLYVLLFHALQIGPSNSRPSFSQHMTCTAVLTCINY